MFLRFLISPTVLLSLLFFTATAFSQIKSEDIENYGYYVASQGVFYQAKPSKLRYKFDLSKLAGISSVPANSDAKPYHVLVYKDEWSLNDTNFYVFDLDFNLHRFNENTVPNVKKLGDNRYQLTFDGLSAGQVLFAMDNSGMYAISIGDLEQEVLSIFNAPTGSAGLIEDRLRLALKSFPENDKLKSLRKTWIAKKAEEKDLAAWKGVEKEYDKYKAENDIDTRDVFAKNALREIKYYLSLGDSPKYKSKALKLQKEIEDNQEKSLAQIKNKKLDIPDQATLKEEVRYFSDGKGLKVAIVEIGNDGDVLIRFSGLKNEYDKKVYRHKKSIQNSRTGEYIYQTRELNGKNRNSFVVENSGWSGRTFVYAPGIDERIYIGSDDSAADDSALQIYRDYVARAKAHNQKP